MIPAKNTALIEFQDVYGSKIAKDHLNNIKLLGSQIKVLFFNVYQFIYFKLSFKKTSCYLNFFIFQDFLFKLQ